MHAWRRLLYRSARWLRGDNPFGILEELRVSERWPPERVREAQAARLRALLCHAAAHVPYYRTRLHDMGIVRDAGSGRVDLSRFVGLPPLTRAALREEARRLQDESSVARGRWVQTGGTTGEPVMMLRDRATHDHAVAVTHWFDGWTGYRLGAPKVVVWARLPRPAPMSLRGLIRAAGAFLRNETRLSCNVLSPALIDGYIRRMNRIRSAQVVGYPSALEAIARRAEAAGQSIRPPGAVMSSGEALAPEGRRIIERAFGAPVFNRYGSDELGGIACECEYHQGLHVSALTHYVEILRADGRPAAPGEPGEVVVTCLTNTAMPLVRYRTGDQGVAGDPGGACPCGRPFPLLQDVTGRVTDAFVKRDGSVVHGLYLHSIYRGRPWIERFQVIQEEVDRVRVRIVLRDGPSGRPERLTEELAAIAAHVRAGMDASCEVRFEFPREILPAPSGKYRTTVSLVHR